MRSGKESERSAFFDSRITGYLAETCHRSLQILDPAEGISRTLILYIIAVSEEGRNCCSDVVAEIAGHTTRYNLDAWTRPPSHRRPGKLKPEVNADDHQIFYPPLL